MLTQTIKNWGNGLAVRLPKAIADQLEFKQGDNVSLDVENGQLIIQVAKPEYQLSDLLEQVTEDNLPESFDDNPVGKELI